MAAFSDLVGLDQEEPNGLIQVEVKRKINIVTKSHLLVPIQNKELSKIDFGKVRHFEVLDKTHQKTLYALQFKNKDKNYLPLSITSEQKKSLLQKHPDPKLVEQLREQGWVAVTVRNRPFRSPYYTFFSSIEPKLLFSKLEQNNRVIDSSKLTNHEINPLQLYRYQLASFGVMVNILKFNTPPTARRG